MIKVKTMKQIATSRTIPSFRSAGAQPRSRDAAADWERMTEGYSQMATHEAHRLWRNHVWRSRKVGTL